MNYTPEDGPRAIPGGRYGCAQFIKTCGPPELSLCSLGKLSQMVQKAVSEDILRYQKTLLVWTESIEKDNQYEFNNKEEHSKKKSEITQKLEIVHRALIDVLRNNLEGIPLAQLPNHLNKKLRFPFNVTELGFTKLKDLVLAMGDNVKIENRGTNHPHAVLVNNEPYHHSQGSFEEFHGYPPQYHQFNMYSMPPKEMKQPLYPQPQHSPQEFDHQNQANMGYAPNMVHPNYYPTYQPVNYPQQVTEMKRDESYSSLHSINEHLNFNRTPNHDREYVPNAESLYGSGGKGYPHQLNISHCRHNTGSDNGTGYDNTLSLAAKHKQVNLSHDFSLNQYRPNKLLNKFGPDELFEINSSGLLSEEESIIYNNSSHRSESPSQMHTRTVSNLDEPDYSYNHSNYMTFPDGINEISEERKSEGDDGGMQYVEDIIMTTVLDDLVSPSPIKPTNVKSIAPWSKKTIPTVSVDATTGTYIDKDKSTPEKECEALKAKLTSAEKLTKKMDHNTK
jgi:hypothetical protein